jgi:hypothetical protein
MLPLRPSSARALAQSTVQRAAREGLGADRTLAALRSAGAGYRRQDFLADYRAAAGRERLVDPLRSLRRDRMPTEALMTAARRHQSQRYMYTVELRVRGLDEPMYRSISTSRRLTRREAEERATDPDRGDSAPVRDRTVTSADLRYVDRSG